MYKNLFVQSIVGIWIKKVGKSPETNREKEQGVLVILLIFAII